MFQGKVVVITGSTQGIGKRTAELLAMRGAKVVINARTRERVDQTVNEFRKKGLDVIGVAGDVSDYSFCQLLAHETRSHFGQVDFLINNAGLAAKGKLEETAPEVFTKMYGVNVMGSIYPTLAFIEDLKASKGGVLFISSLAGIIGLPSYLTYSATKRSIVSIAESLKNELFDDGVYIGINYPSFTENDGDKQTISPTGKPVTMIKREDVKVEPLDKTVLKIIRQIEKRKFRVYSSWKGRAFQTIYRLFPSLALYILKKNRRKIMNMQ